MPSVIVHELARAKINLTLHVTGRRADGLHLLDSLVVFAELGDHLSAQAAPDLSLAIDGPFGAGLGATDDNLVLRAAAHIGGAARLRLTKGLPISSGIGGGSADAAAAIRALARLQGHDLPQAASLQVLGADVPVCLASRTARMQGIGEEISPLPPLPPCWVVLVNPGVSVATPAVFRALHSAQNLPMQVPDSFGDFGAFMEWLAMQRNDLEPPALHIAPVVAQVLATLRQGPQVGLARMSGSGATCFGLYPDEAAARLAVRHVAAARPEWWVAAAPLRHG